MLVAIGLFVATFAVWLVARDGDGAAVGTGAVAPSTVVSAAAVSPESTLAPTTVVAVPTPASTTVVSPNELAPAPTVAVPSVGTQSVGPHGGQRCVVNLHGKGSSGSSTTVAFGLALVAPSGNATGWGGRQWLYFPDPDYQAARSIVASSIADAGCDRVVLHGFSNGAAFAAKLYCRGETFGGRLAIVVVDDPVTDAATIGCHPARGVTATLYWTGALTSQAPAGWPCVNADWTCEGGASVGVDAYALALGLKITPSPMSGHTPYVNAPELTSA